MRPQGGYSGLREDALGLREAAQGLKKVTQGSGRSFRASRRSLRSLGRLREAGKVTCGLSGMNWGLWKITGDSSRLI